MAIPRIKVLDYNGLGNIFIDWALGKTQVPPNLDEFKEAVKNVIDVTPGNFPGYINDFKHIQGPKELLLLRLPPAELVQDTIDSIDNGEPYSFPQQVFYGPIIVNKQRDFFGFRVGDYTIAHCS